MRKHSTGSNGLYTVNSKVLGIRDLEFKYLYFKIQALINKKVLLSLKYEQIKTPEMHATLVKPISMKVVEFASVQNLIRRVSSNFDAQSINYGSFKLGQFSEGSDYRVSIYLVFVLLLLRYEFLIQSERNLIRYDLLNTKAMICEVLAIRMLREYQNNDCINLLFVSPLRQAFRNSDQMASVNFNTLELAVISKSKKFLSQPFILQILDRFYNGDLVLKTSNAFINESILRELSEDYDAKGIEDQSNLLSATDKQTVVEYKSTKVSLRKVIMRARIVPKYQALVANMRLMLFAFLHLILILYHRNSVLGNSKLGWPVILMELVYWIIGLCLNVEFFSKLLAVNLILLRKVLWNYLDMILIFLVNVSFVLRMLFLWRKIGTSWFYDSFSLVSIVLLPRILSVLNNYEFFNTILLSFKSMLWRLFGLFFLFSSLISGFYLAFISLSIGRSSSNIAFDMLKIFFSFTPAVWSNWDNYNTLGRFVQMAYLFLSQFIISTILAIALSQVFAKVYESTKEEFACFKAANLVVYFKVSEFFYNENYHLNSRFSIFGYILDFFKLPMIFAIYVYEICTISYHPTRESSDMKYFTFLNTDSDLLFDPGFSLLDDDANDSDNFLLGRKSRKGLNVARSSNQNKANFSNFFNTLATAQSISTLRNFRSASTDSILIDELLTKKYGGNIHLRNHSTSIHVPRKVSRVKQNSFSKSVFEKKSSDIIASSTKTSKSKRQENAKIMSKLDNVEHLLSTLVNHQTMNMAHAENAGSYYSIDDLSNSLGSAVSVINHSIPNAFSVKKCVSEGNPDIMFDIGNDGNCRTSEFEKPNSYPMRTYHDLTTSTYHRGLPTDAKRDSDEDACPSFRSYSLH